MFWNGIPQEAAIRACTSRWTKPTLVRPKFATEFVRCSCTMSWAATGSYTFAGSSRDLDWAMSHSQIEGVRRFGRLTTAGSLLSTRGSGDKVHGPAPTLRPSCFQKSPDVGADEADRK